MRTASTASWKSATGGRCRDDHRVVRAQVPGGLRPQPGQPAGPSPHTGGARRGGRPVAGGRRPTARRRQRRPRGGDGHRRMGGGVPRRRRDVLPGLRRPRRRPTTGHPRPARRPPGRRPAAHRARPGRGGQRRRADRPRAPHRDRHRGPGGRRHPDVRRHLSRDRRRRRRSSGSWSPPRCSCWRCRGSSSANRQGSTPRWRTCAHEAIAVIPLLAFSLVLGVFPRFVLDVIEPASRHVVDLVAR